MKKTEKQKRTMVMEGYQMVSSVRRMSIYTERVIIEMARLIANQEETKEKITYHIPAQTIMKGSNYTDLEHTINEMQELVIKRKTEKSYESMTLFPYMKAENGQLEIDINWRSIQFMRDISKGYRLYEYKTIMQFISPYTTMLYKLLNGESDIMTYTIEEIRNLTGTTETYRSVNIWVKRVIEQAQKEMKEKADFYFKYELIKSKNTETGRPFYNKIMFIKLKARKAEKTKMDKDIEKTYGISMLDREIYNILKFQMEFEEWEIQNNSEMISNAQTKKGRYEVIQIVETTIEYIRKNRDKIKNPKGYLMKILKEKCE